MEKIKKWRRFALALFSLLFVGILSFALVQVIPSKADEEPYPECTAKYRIIEVQTNFYWDGSYWRVHSSDGSEKKMVLQIEQEGTFVIDWGTNRSYGKGNAPMLYVYKYTDSAQKGEALSSVQGNGSTSQSAAMECKIENVQIGDYVEIVFIETEHDTNSYALLWMNAPTNTVNLSASVATDSIGKGHIKSDYSIGHSGEEVDSDTYTIQWTAPFSVTAVAGEGNYFAYWTNKAGDILTRSETYTVKNVLAKNAEDYYYAHFVSSDYSAMQSSGKEGKPFWNSTDGKWSFDFSNYSPADKDVASLTYDFVAEEGQFVSFDYFQSCNAFTAISQKSSYPIFRIYLNGTELKKFVPYNATHEETDAIGNFAVPVTKSGYNQLEFRFYVVYAFRDSWKYEEGDQLYVDNIKVCDEKEVQTTQFVFTFESKWLKVTCTDVAKKETKEISSGVPVDLSNGTMWQISSSAKNSKKPSEFDSSIQVNYSRTGVWTSEAGDISSYFVPQGKAIATRSTDFSSSNSSVKTFRLDGKTEIATGYKEEVPLGVSATKTTDGEDTMIDIPRGTTIDFPFGKENTMVVRIDTYGHFQAENYTITLDGQAYSGRIEALDDFLAFVLTDVKNHIVSIKYNLPDEGKYIYSKTFVEFMVKEGVEGGIENIVKTPDSLNVEDTKDWGGRDTWLFDPELSEEGNYVYQASNSFLWIDESVSSGQGGLSTLAFSMKDTVAEQAGSISFEFQISGSYFTDGKQQLLGAYLCYKTGKAVEQSVFWNMMSGQAKPEDLKDLAQSRTGGEIITGNGVAKAGDWYRANIMIQKGETIYVSFFSYNVKPYGDQIDTYLNIRNIRLNVGNANVKIERGTNAQGTVTSAIGEQRNENKTEAVSYNVSIGSTLELSAAPGANEVFYGWSVNGALVSTEPTVSLFVEGEMNVVAWMAPANFYAARAEGRFFKTIEEAVESADGGTVYVLQDTTITKSFTIPSGVTLLIPYNDANGFMEAGKSGTADNKISWLNPTYKDAYRTVTVKAGATITVQGTLRVGAVVNYLVGQGYQGHTSGAYAELILETGSSIQVAKGGVMDVYGRVWGGEGKTGSDMGTIDVANGGKLYEPFLILDFAGGTNAFVAFFDGTTPFKRYAMINIEVPMTVHYGGMLYGHASLWVESMTLHASLDQPFISYDMGEGKGGDGQGADTFVMLHKGASVKLTYNPNKIVGNASAENCTEGIGETTMIFEGGATFSYMKFSAMGFTIPTSPVMFSIPYNYNVEFNKGEKSGEEIDATYNQYETVTDFMIMPGATVKVGAGATLTLNANTWVLDGFAGGAQAGKQYPLKADLAEGGYSASGNLIVNGTLKIGRKSPIKVSVTISLDSEDESVPAIFIGIVQTEGGGRIEIPADTVLNGKVWAGLEKQDYFAYTTTARVWDKVHNCFGDLVAGHTYTATSGDGFTLTDLRYTNTEGGDENQTLELSSDMVGSWKVEHTEHHEPVWEYGKTYGAAADGTAGENGHKQLTRYCTELGCDHQFHKELFNTPNELADVYKGKEFTDSDLVALFKKFFEGFPAGVTVTAATDQQTNVGTYEVTVTLEGGFFLEGDEFVDHVTIRWRITPFILSAETAECSGTATTVYNGGEQKLTPSVNTAAGVLQSGDFKISYSEDVKNVGEVTVTVTGQGNFEGSVTWTYEITPIQVTLQLTQQSTDYTGNEPTVKSEGTFTATGILDGDKGNVQIELALKGGQGTDGWNVGDYGLTASLTCTDGHENYVLANPATIYENMLRIVPKSIAEANVVLNAETFTYSGAAQTPFKELELAGYTFRDGDYEVSYSDNTNAGKATVTVTGRGNFTGKTETTFTIDPLSLAGAKITAAACTYNGAPHTPTLTVQVGTLNLTSESDYTVQYNNNTNAGTATVTITGRNNFCGTAEGHFEIAQAQVTITAENKNSPEGQNLVTLTYTITGYFEEEATLRAALKISVADGTETGKAGDKFVITVAFTSEDGAKQFPNYTFTFKEGEYTITAAVFANVTFEDGSAVYDREAHTLVADLVDPDDKDGTFGATYSYKKGDSAVEEMRDAGTYTVTLHLTFTVSESEVYSVELERTFTITPATITKVTVTAGDFTYTGKQITPTLTVETDGLTLTAEEYTVSYGAHGNINAGTVEVTVTASSTNFVGSAKTDFEIAKRDISDAEVSVSGSYTYNGTPIVPKTEEVTVTLDDYDVTFSVSASDNTNASENVPVTVTGTGNFSGSAEGTFRIAPKAAKVTVQPQSHVYSGTQPTLTAEKGTDWVSSDICGDDDLQITLTAVAKGEAWDVGTYSVEGRSANGNYTVEFLACENKCTITPKSITVTIMDAESEYGEEIAPLTWTIPEGALGAGDEKSDLGVTLALTGGETRRTVGTYRIEANADAKNYTVTFAGSMDGTYGTYTVTRRNITVTILPQHAVYDNAAPVLSELQDVAWTVEEGAIVEGDTLGVRLTLTAPEDGKWNAGNYVIGGTASNTNYQVAFSEDVKFTIERRAVTVTVADQSADYDYLYEYAKDGSAWTVAEALAQGEDRDDLQITLDFGEITTAGTYPIRGECANNNYAVTFRGSMEDCGTYTVNKKDLSEGRAIFRLSSGDKTSGNYMLTVALSSEFIDLDSSASVFEGTTPKTLQTTVTPSRLTEVGTHKVQIEIVDDNYCGGAEFTVIVTYANGYTERLQTTMQRLRELAEGKSADALKEEDFDDLKEMATLLAALNAEERGLAADDLEKYDDLVNAWNDLADLDGIIETAEAVASAPLSGLFGAISTLTALAALAFVVTKGGLL